MEIEAGLANVENKLVEGRALQLHSRIQALRVIDEESFTLIQELAKENRKHINAIETRFKDSVEAAHRAHKEAISIRNEALGNFEENQQLAKDKILQYSEATGIEPSVPGIIIQKKWHAEIVNENLIPREYLVPDLKKIQGIASQLGDQLKIPGILVTPLAQVAVRSE